MQLRAPVGTDARLSVERVLVASTLPIDRVTLMQTSPGEGGSYPALHCKGRFFADAIGPSELRLVVRPPGAATWSTLLVVPVTVQASKLMAEQFELMFHDLQREAAAALFDIHGKSRMGMKAAPLRSAAPVAVLARLRSTVRELTDLLYQIARQPASRLRAHTTREQSFPGQAVSEATLAALCDDPSMLARQGNLLVVREQLREYTRPDFRIPEHRALADFAAYLVSQLADLRQRIDTEITSREERRAWRNLRRESGTLTWWESEDKPRIEELMRARQELTRLRASIEHWHLFPFLLPGTPLRQLPPSTPLFRNHTLYRRAWRTMANHFQNFEATLDLQPLLTQIRSLPVLYEWWCAVRVMRVLSSVLLPLQTASLITPDGRRFSLEFTPDQMIEFGDAQGFRVRFRYEPVFTAQRDRGQPIVLDGSSRRTPDLVLEIYPPQQDQPDLLIVLDAKYSSRSPWDKMTEVAAKYSRIGDATTGRILSRQVWALTPTGTVGPTLRDCALVDNSGFWSPQFTTQSAVNGALVVRPLRVGEYDPLRELIEKILGHAGLRLERESGVPQANEHQQQEGSESEIDAQGIAMQGAILGEGFGSPANRVL
jgi:hypothetical protein